MKPFTLIFALIILCCGCKKSIQKQEENAIVKAMTDGQWVVTSFTSNTSDLTASFSPYKFQYFSDNTVSAINNGNVEKTGTWQGDVTTMTISAYFTDATDPLLLLNGTWKVDDNGWTYVKATLTIGSEVRKLRLDKE